MIARLRAAIRRDPQMAVIFTLATIAAILPIWIGRYLPLLDYPNHLASTFVWSHLHDPAFGYDKYYESNLAPLPYWALYGLEYVLSIPFGIEVAQKLFLTGAVVGLPISIAVYARRMGRDPRLALFAFPLAWNVNTANGFLSYIAGIPILFFALAALDKYAERPSLRWGVITALIGSSLYFFHIITWGVFLAVGGVVALITPRPWTWWRALLAPLPTLPTLLLGLACYKLGNAASVNLPINSPKGLSAFQGSYNSVSENLTMVPSWLLDFYPGERDELFAIILAFAWMFLLSARALSRGPEEGATLPRELPLSDLRAWRVELAGLIVFALYMLLPRSLMLPFYWFAVNRRLAVIVALFAVLLVRGPIAGARRWLLAAAAVAAILFPLDLAAHFHRFNQRLTNYEAVIESVPRGKRVLPLMMNLTDPEVNANAFNNWGAYLQIRLGGYMVQYFPVEFPIRYKTPQRFAAPSWDHPDSFDFRWHGAPWDYFLIHGPTKRDPFVGAHDKVKLVKKSGDWELWGKF